MKFSSFFKLGCAIVIVTVTLASARQSHRRCSHPSDAQEAWFENQLDHFSFGNGPASFKQRYYYCIPETWKGGDTILAYVGNEGPVTLYVNSTGLMWENAENLNAMLVFMEHRYYGETSMPDQDTLQHLSHEQALADYASLLYSIQTNYSAFDSPIFAIGGSYGGMLAAWARYQYPDIFYGAIAASAPIFAFRGEGYDFFNNGGNSYWQTVTRTAGDECASKVRDGFEQLLVNTTSIRRAETFKICPSSHGAEAVDTALWIANAFDIMAMGDFPFESNYLTGDSSVYLPAYPMKVACERVMKAPTALEGLAGASSLLYNASGKLTCSNIPTTDKSPKYDRFSGNLWTWQYCTETMPEEFFFTMNGKDDMFFSYNNPLTPTENSKSCMSGVGVEPDYLKIRTRYGGKEDYLNSVSRIIFSNGMKDPWSSGGVKEVPEGQELYVISIESGAHHQDLMFENEHDLPDMKAARKQELSILKRWIFKSKASDMVEMTS